MDDKKQPAPRTAMGDREACCCESHPRREQSVPNVGSRHESSSLSRCATASQSRLINNMLAGNAASLTCIVRYRGKDWPSVGPWRYALDPPCTHGDGYGEACYPSISASANSVTIVVIPIFHRLLRCLITSLLPESVSSQCLTCTRERLGDGFSERMRGEKISAELSGDLMMSWSTRQLSAGRPHR